MILKEIGNVRTNNFNDPDILHKITTVWQQSLEELQEHRGIKYGVYHAYQRNYKEDYTLSIAVEKNSYEAGKSQKELEIPEGKYKIFEVEDNNPENVFSKWQEIWQMEEEGKLERAYTFDYEKYTPEGKIEIYIQIK